LKVQKVLFQQDWTIISIRQLIFNKLPNIFTTIIVLKQRKNDSV